MPRQISRKLIVPARAREPLIRNFVHSSRGAGGFPPPVGIKNTHKKVYLLDWMNTYMEAQEKRGKKDVRQIKTTIKILKAYTNERMLLNFVLWLRLRYCASAKCK